MLSFSIHFSFAVVELELVYDREMVVVASRCAHHGQWVSNCRTQSGNIQQQVAGRPADGVGEHGEVLEQSRLWNSAFQGGWGDECT